MNTPWSTVAEAQATVDKAAQAFVSWSRSGPGLRRELLGHAIQ